MRLRNERGAIAVEAAAASVLLIVLFLGTIEFGLIFRAQGAFQDGAYAGAREASTLARDANFNDNAAAAVNGVLAGVNFTSIETIVIFKVDPATGGPIGGGSPETCVQDCFRWQYSDLGYIRDDPADTWDDTEQAACVGEDADLVGVYLKGRFGFITGFFGQDRVITETTILPLEPLPLETQCKPTS